LASVRTPEGANLSIDDKFEKLAGQLAAEGEVTLQNRAINAAVASLPYMGAAIGSLWAGDARRRLVARLLALFAEVKQRLEAIEAELMDGAFFETEEFQTLLALAVEQLQTAHDSRKVKLLAAALASSGTKEYSKDGRKELFVRALRELTADEVLALGRMRPRRINGFIQKPEDCGPEGEDLLVMQRLGRLGLIEERVKGPGGVHLSGGTDPGELRDQFNALRDSISKPPQRCFRISDFGLDFLRFVGEESGAASDPRP
jgi:hypothetical protein